MISHDEMLDNVAVYALGALPRGRGAEVAAHLKTCESCRAEYELLRPAVTAVGSSAADYDDALCPGPMLKARIMREVRNSERANAKAYRWETFAAIAAALVLTVGALLLYTTMDRHIVSQTALMAAQSAALADLAAADVKRYRFGDGRFSFGAVISTSRFRASPSPRPVRSTRPGRCRRAPRRWRRRSPLCQTNATSPSCASPNRPDVAAVAVSVEPAGGSKQPTSKPIAVAAL